MSPPEFPRPGRNDPCPCGSGRKYKHCHLRADEEARSVASPVQHLHDLDGRLVHDLCGYAKKRFGDAWWSFEEDFVDAEESAQLSLAWSVFHHRVEGAPVVDRYLEEKGRRLSTEERTWLAAQKAAWLSVWEVLSVEPGKAVVLRDLITGEERRVAEVGGSRTLVARDAVLARVVDHEGSSLLCGVHPRPLPPISAAEVLRRMRSSLRRRGPLDPDRLRDDAVGRILIRIWEEAVASLDARPRLPKALQNTDGDPLLLTTDHFEVMPGAASAVAAGLSAIADVDPPDPGDESGAYVFKRPGNRVHDWENTIVGSARISEKTLRLETNSQNRADALRRMVESACGPMIRHRLREHADPLSEKAPRGLPVAAPSIPPDEAARIVHEFKRRHYQNWLDESIPALGGKTPREAVRTARGRTAVDVLLKDIENREQRVEDSPFDFSWLRRELGLDVPGKR